MKDYAENIKKIRKMKGITQSELADRISSQGMISRVEKKQLSPDIDLLEAIAKKLDCSIIDLLSSDNELEQVSSYLESLVSKRKYILLEKVFRSDQTIEKMKVENEGFYKWVNGVILCQNYNDYDTGIQEMESAFESTNDVELKVRILNGLSGLYSEVGKIDKSLDRLQEALLLSKRYDINQELKQKINFQMSRLYSVINKFSDSIYYSRVGIQYSIEYNSLYLLDDLYLLLADSYYKINELDKAKENIDIAYIIAQVKNNKKLLSYIERTYYKIKEKMKET